MIIQGTNLGGDPSSRSEIPSYGGNYFEVQHFENWKLLEIACQLEEEMLTFLLFITKQ